MTSAARAGAKDISSTPKAPPAIAKTSGGSSASPPPESTLATAPLPPSIITILTILIALLIGAQVYSNSFKVPFVFDDGNNIVLNKPIHLYELTVPELKKVLIGSWNYNRTVAMLSFSANYYFNRVDVFGYHLVNFLIHISMAISVYFFAVATLTLPSTEKQYGRYARQIAVASALIFVVHPVQTQAVTYVVQRMTSMAALFYMLSILAYIKARKEDTTRPIIFFALSVLCGLLGFGTKQNTIVLPVTILFYELYFFQTINLQLERKNIDTASILKISGIVLGALVVTIMVTKVYTDSWNPFSWIFGEYYKRDFTPKQRVLTELRVLIHYIALMVFPHPSRLNLDYDFPLSNALFSPPTTFLSLFILFWIIYLAFYFFRREPLISFGIFWFYENLILESSILALDIVNEHRLYLPSATFFMISTYIFIKAVEKITADNNKRGWIKSITFFIILLTFGSWTHKRNDAWKSVISILEDVTQKSPQKARQFINLGVAYSNAREFDKAIVSFRQSIRIDPKYPETHNNLGNVYNKMGQFDKAIAEYRKAILMRPNYNEALNNMGSTYTKMRNYKKAIELHKAALGVNPRSEKTYNNLGVAYSNAGEFDNAVKSYKTAIDINPHFIGAWTNLGSLYRAAQDFNNAISIFKKAMAIFPNAPTVHFNLADTYAAAKQIDKAIFEYNEALKLNPNYAEALNNLGLVYMNNRDYDKAVSLYQQALLVMNRPEFHYNLGLVYMEKGLLQLSEQEFRVMIAARPNFPDSYYNLGMIYTKAGNIDQAIITFEETLKRNPSHIFALSQLGSIYLKSKNDPRKSLEYYRKITRTAPEDPNTGNIKNIIARIEEDLGLQPGGSPVSGQ